MSVFVAVPFRAMDDPALDATDLLTLTAICRYADYGTGICYPSAASIGRSARLGRSAVFESLKHLEMAGYLRRTPSRKAGEATRQTSNTYQVIYDLTPQQVKAAMADFPTVHHADAPPSTTRTETIDTLNESTTTTSAPLPPAVDKAARMYELAVPSLVRNHAGFRAYVRMLLDPNHSPSYPEAIVARALAEMHGDGQPYRSGRLAAWCQNLTQVPSTPRHGPHGSRPSRSGLNFINDLPEPPECP